MPRPAWDSPHFELLPDEEPELEPPPLLLGSVLAVDFFFLVVVGVSALAVLGELELIVLLELGEVDELVVPLYVELVVPLGWVLGAVEVLEGAVVVVLVVVFGAALFLLWSPRANAEPLASATRDVIRTIGASLRI